MNMGYWLLVPAVLKFKLFRHMVYFVVDINDEELPVLCMILF